MPLLRCLTLLLILVSPLAMANGQYQVEVIFFRQSGEQIPSSQLAPEDWAAGSQRLAAGSITPKALEDAAAKLTPANGYQVILHQAWVQYITPSPVKLALTSGNQIYGHYPVEGTLTFSQERMVSVAANFWINQLSPDGAVIGSEHLKGAALLVDRKLTYIDHGSLGLLIRISPM